MVAFSSKHPQVLGDGIAGTIVEVGPGVKRLKVNDKVFGFTWRSQQEKAYQIYATAPENLLGVIPDDITTQEAVTLPNNFVTAYHTFVTDLGLTLPWPKPTDYTPKHAEDPILIWGGSSSRRSICAADIEVLRLPQAISNSISQAS